MEKNKKKFKVGDCVMIDGGGVAYCKYGVVDKIDDKYIYLKDIYERQRVSLYPGQIDVFTYEYSYKVYTGEVNGYSEYENSYLVKKSEYNAIAKTYKKFSTIKETISSVFRHTYFESKRR